MPKVSTTETGAQASDPEFVGLWAGPGRNGGGVNIVWPRWPGRAELARLMMPVLVAAAGRSRQNDCAALEAGARMLPDACYVLIDEATHFWEGQWPGGASFPSKSHIVRSLASMHGRRRIVRTR